MQGIEKGFAKRKGNRLMKKIVIVYVLAMTFFVLSPTAFATTERSQLRDTKQSVFTFPASLEKIEKEAFMGTAVKTAVFQDGLHFIGDSAFADSYNLTDAFIPSSIEYMGKNAFPSNIKLTIHGVIGSLAEKWAKEHEIPFMPSNIWTVIDENKIEDQADNISIDRCFQLATFQMINSLHGRTEDEGNSMRPQERPELNPIDYRFP